MNRTSTQWIGVGALCVMCACADNTTSSGRGGGTIQPGVKVQGLYVANSDGNTVSRLDLDTNVVREIEVGKEPANIARIGSRIFITLRNERAIAVLEEEGEDIVKVASIPTGAEPFGIVTTAKRIYVAESVEGRVSEIDAASFQTLRTWQLPGEPRWLALHSSEGTLYVASTYGGHFTAIDLSSGNPEEIPLPERDTFDGMMPAPTPLAVRITGAPVSSPDGKAVYVPALYVDNKSEIPDVSGDTSVAPPKCMPPTGAPPPPSPPSNGGTSGMGAGGMVPVDPPPGGLGCGGGYDHQKFNPVVVAMPADPSRGKIDANAVNEVFQAHGAIAQQNGFMPVNGYLSALQISGDSKILLASVEGAGAVLAFDMTQNSGPQPIVANGAGAAKGGAVPVPAPGGTFGFEFRNTITIATGSGPRGIALVGDHQAYVQAFFSHRIEQIDLDRLTQVFSNQSSGGGGGGGVIGVAGGPIPPGVDVVGSTPTVERQITTSNPTIVTSSALPPDVEEGRNLFFAANNPVMATVGAGVSCGTCHFDGRTDGITWTFHRGPRQTPMLAVNLKDALPVGWAGNVPTVADEGFNTSQKLMGGTGITTEQTAALQAFLFSLRTVDTPMKGSLDARVQHGAALFSEVGCVACHNGPSHTNNQIYSMFGLDKVKTRPLASIAASAPYFHDGSATRLEDVVDRASAGEMGSPFTISASDKADLVLFLKSL